MIIMFTIGFCLNYTKAHFTLSLGKKKLSFIICTDFHAFNEVRSFRKTQRYAIFGFSCTRGSVIFYPATCPFFFCSRIWLILIKSRFNGSLLKFF